MSQRIEVCRAVSVTHPQAFLTCGFEAGIVTLTLCTQGIDTLKTQAFPVNGKSVIVWNGLILGTAPVFLPIVPILVVTRANTGFGLAEGAAEFLAGTPIVGGLAILVHSQPSLTDRITGRKRSYVQLYCQCPIRERRIETGIGRGKENVIDAPGFSEMS